MLSPILSLGMQYLTNFIDSPSEEHHVAPLELVICNKKKGGCGLVQLRHTVPGDLLYRKFWYKSGTNQTMRDALAEITAKAASLAKLGPGDIAIDIGANDGTLLRSYKNKGIRLVGFEPAENLVDEAKVGTTLIINDFFSHKAFKKEFGNKKAKIITSIAMFYDLEDPNSFVKDITRILDKDGIWIIQMNYLATMLKNNAFDNIVHEHLEYYSLKSLQVLLRRHDLVVFDAELNDLNGGSIRTYIKHGDCKKYPITPRVKRIRRSESTAGLDNYRTYVRFANRIRNLKKRTFDLVRREVVNGKKVYAYGASTRGNTLLQYYDLDHNLIEAAADRNPAKWGKKTVSSLIPIISEEKARSDRPDYFFILPWYFAKEFLAREKDFLADGGRFIIPLPTLKVV